MKNKVMLPEDFTPFLSPYITGGYRNDISFLKKVVVENDKIIGTIKVEDYYISENTNEFHLSVPIAMLWVFQLAIIFGCLDNNLENKKGEHYMRELVLKCKKEITKLEFTCSLKLLSKKIIGNKAFYKGQILIDEGSFIGTASFIMPL